MTAAAPGTLPAGSSARWVDAQSVQALSGLLARAKVVADGALAGLHLSRRHGRSVEFAEHKVYTPGDDTRLIDWKTYAKTDRHYVKRFAEETNLRCFCVLDVSGSMSYAGGGPGSLPGVGKLDYARTLAASLMYLLIRQADSVGCMTFAESAGPHTALRGGERQLAEILTLLDSAHAVGNTRPLEALHSLRNHVSRRAWVVVFTDLLDAGRDVMEPLTALRNRGADVSLIHVLHPDETQFPFDGTVRFLDLEGTRETQLDAPAVRSAYLQELNQWLEISRITALECGVDYQRVSTQEPPARALLRFLLPRRKIE